MPCIFCRSDKNLTREHVFPAFVGGELEVPNGSCATCNRELSQEEAALKASTTPLLNLLKIQNRYGIVPNARANARIRGLDIKDLPAFVNGEGEIKLIDVVKESTSADGRRLRQGFFLKQESADKFSERARAKGLQVIGRDMPPEIVVDAEYELTVDFVASLPARKVAAKIALTAIAYEFGVDFALTAQFDALRAVHTKKSLEGLPVVFFSNPGLMEAYLHNPFQHSVISYLSAGMQKAWAVVTLFGGVCYLVVLAGNYTERESRQFSLHYDAETKRRFDPIVLANEMTLIGHVLSPATKFEDPDALHEQWSPLLSEYCIQKGIVLAPIKEK